MFKMHYLNYCFLIKDCNRERHCMTSDFWSIFEEITCDVRLEYLEQICTSFWEHIKNMLIPITVADFYSNCLEYGAKTFTENWDSKRHLLELSWPI